MSMHPFARSTLAVTLRDLHAAFAKPLQPTDNFDHRVERGELRGELAAAIRRIESALALDDEQAAAE